MEDFKEGGEVPLSRGQPLRHRADGRHVLWFALHLAAVYIIVIFATPWLAGWTRERLLPFLQYPTSSGPFEFLFSHILIFSFVPAFFSGAP
jgi:hypothetical protein